MPIDKAYIIKLKSIEPNFDLGMALSYNPKKL